MPERPRHPLQRHAGAASLGARWQRGLCYGAMGAPLAFAALPVYVHLPSHYAGQLGAPLAGMGLVLLGARALDALVDPWLGRVADRALDGPPRTTLCLAAGATLLLGGGMALLFFPPIHLLPPLRATAALLAWCAAALALTCLGYSMLSVLHTAWGARLGGGAAQQAQWVGWREALALAGVLAASVLPAVGGVGAMVAACAGLLALAWAGLANAPYPGRPAPSGGLAIDAWLPWRGPAFRRLMAVYVVNGIASAVPATLVLFFVRDRLQAPAFEPLFLSAYFAAAALSVPLWVRAVAHFGPVRTWLAGMALAVLSFAWAAGMGSGAVLAFAAVCVASGAALGADLIVPATLLTGVVGQAGHAQQREGIYFGWWACATKLNLALAAGLALPLLQHLGYAPGARGVAPLNALALAYAAVPSLFKLLAAAMLWRFSPALDSR